MKNGNVLQLPPAVITMLKIISITITTLISISYQSMAEVSTDACSAGMGNARSIYGGGIDAPALNPALLGAELGPRNGIRCIPLTSFCVGAWSDKFALLPYREYLSITKDDTWQRIVNQILVSSFAIADASPEESSKRISDKIKGGASIYAGMNLPLLGVTFNHWAFAIRTEAHTEIDLPEAPFLILFSETEGLREGTTLPLSHLGMQARVTTDLNAAYGIPLDLSAITDRINTLTKDFTDLSHASFGGGFTVSLGHSYVNLETADGGVHYDETPEGLYLDGTIRLKTAGTGLQRNWNLSIPFKDDISITGWGTGINAGVLLYGEHSAVSLGVSRLGPMFWNNVAEGEFYVRTRDLSVVPLLESGDRDLFDTATGGVLPDETNTPDIIGTYASWMPTRLNFGFGYRFDFMHHPEKNVRMLTNYVHTIFEYEQSLAPWPGRSFIPRFTLAAEDGFLWGIVPVRAGFIFGGHERVASTVGFGIGFPYFRIETSYKAIGTPYWYPKNGFEYGFGLRTEWGRFRDPDNDGVSNRTDRAPFTSEDIDGFEDEDGIPDPDNDNDGIPDSTDSCIITAEDRDGFNDEDGCPDYDNDVDKIADTLDNCPFAAEDIDSFQDEDGCPDPDNDADGIADSLDECPLAAENIDGVADDGCPETIIDFSEEFKRHLDTNIINIAFTSSGEFSEATEAALDSLVGLLGQYTSDYFIIWSDTTIADSLCRARSQAIACSLAERGVSENQLIYPLGSTRPFASLRNVADHPLGIKILFPAETITAPKQEPPSHEQ